MMRHITFKFEYGHQDGQIYFECVIALTCSIENQKFSDINNTDILLIIWLLLKNIF